MSYKTDDQTYAAQNSQSKDAAQMSTVLTAFGLPNKDGHLDWPIALKILRPDEETRNLRQQIDTVIRVLANRQASDNPNPLYISQARRALERLGSLMDSERYSLTTGTYKEGKGFLAKLERFLNDADHG